MIQKSVDKDIDVYKEFHALLVELGKSYCKKKPLCEKCPLNELCQKNLK